MDCLKEQTRMLCRCAITAAVYLQQPCEDRTIENKEIIVLLGKVIILYRE